MFNIHRFVLAALVCADIHTHWHKLHLNVLRSSCAITLYVSLGRAAFVVRANSLYSLQDCSGRIHGAYLQALSTLRLCLTCHSAHTWHELFTLSNKYVDPIQSSTFNLGMNYLSPDVNLL